MVPSGGSAPIRPVDAAVAVVMPASRSSVRRVDRTLEDMPSQASLDVQEADRGAAAVQFPEDAQGLASAEEIEGRHDGDGRSSNRVPVGRPGAGAPEGGGSGVGVVVKCVPLRKGRSGRPKLPKPPPSPLRFDFRSARVRS